jgi:hypothetical protein
VAEAAAELNVANGDAVASAEVATNAPSRGQLRMSDTNASKVAAALDCLRQRGQYFEFDNQERVVKVAISGGTATDEVAAHVGNLHDLRELIFERTELTDQDLRHLRGLTNLQKLSISGSPFSVAGLELLSPLSRLDHIYIGEGRDLDAAAFAAIARLQGLRKLSMGGGSFGNENLSPLAALTNLEELSFDNHRNKVNGTFGKYLVDLPRLADLSPGEDITDNGIASIAKLVRLRVLFLEGPFITDAGLRQICTLRELPNLIRLSIRVPRFTDAGAAILPSCRRLSAFTEVRSSMTAAGRRMLRTTMPDCDFHFFPEHKGNRQDDDE